MAEVAEERETDKKKKRKRKRKRKRKEREKRRERDKERKEKEKEKEKEKRKERERAKVKENEKKTMKRERERERHFEAFDCCRAPIIEERSGFMENASTCLEYGALFLGGRSSIFYARASKSKPAGPHAFACSSGNNASAILNVKINAVYLVFSAIQAPALFRGEREGPALY